MTDRASIIQLIRDTWVARRADNLDGVMSGFHPMSTFRFMCAPEFEQMSATVRGADVHHMMAQLIGEWDLSHLDIKTIGIDDDTAYVHHVGQARNKRTGNVMNADVLDVIRVADGKIIEYTQFTDTYLVAKTAGMI